MVTCPTQTQKAQPGIRKARKLEILISIQSAKNTMKFLIVIRFQVEWYIFPTEIKNRMCFRLPAKLNTRK